MDLHTCTWDQGLLDAWGIPAALLPEIRSSSEIFGHAHSSSLLREVPIAGILGDQQAATFGQAAFDKGESKNTYGTGNFLIVNTGEKPVMSQNGLLTTVAYQLGEEAPRYALEGSIAVTGSLVQWLRDNLGIISRSANGSRKRTSKHTAIHHYLPKFGPRSNPGSLPKQRPGPPPKSPSSLCGP